MSVICPASTVWSVIILVCLFFFCCQYISVYSSDACFPPPTSLFIERLQRLETRLILKHADKHLFVHLVRRGGPYDAADLLQAPLQVARRSLDAHHPQTVGQALGEIQVVVCRLPQVNELKDVLPGRAGRNHSLDVLLLNSDPRKAVGDYQEVIQGQVF